MCFVLDENSKIRKLRKDKIIYKIITEDNRSPYKSYFCWEENKRYELRKSLEINIYQEIYKGFHAYISYVDALIKSNYLKEKIIKITIPKGSEYIENKWGECVSNIVETKSLKNIYKNK